MEIFKDDYNKRLDEHIKNEFKNFLKPSHPCEFQKKNCLKSSLCPLIGLPDDICIYYIRGNCKFDKCKYKHDFKYANIYKNTKDKFKIEEKKPYALFRRYFKRFIPYIMWFIGLIFSYLIRKILDYFGKKVF